MSWVDKLDLELKPFLERIGFIRRRRRGCFFSREAACEKEYNLDVWLPYSSDDPHQLYIVPRINVDIPEISRLRNKLLGGKRSPDYKTIGSDIGNLKTGFEKWAVDDEASALALVPQFVKDIKEVAVPYWEMLSTPEGILRAMEENHPWAQPMNSWELQLTLILYLRGSEAAMEYFKVMGKRFRPDEKLLIRKILSGEALLPD